MVYTVFDLESDGLRGHVTVIHCLSYQKISSTGEVLEKGTFTRPTREQLKPFFEDTSIIVGHNIIRYDCPVIKDMFGDIQFQDMIDTLALSWYTWPNRLKHGLEAHGDDEGVEKPAINDWKNLTQEEYEHRCETDVEINVRMFVRMLNYLNVLYEGDTKKVVNLMNYLSYKLVCAQEQEESENKLTIDRELVESSLSTLEVLRKERMDALADAMPEKINYVLRTQPLKLIKKDGNVTALGQKWFDLLLAHNLPLDYQGNIEVEKSRETGNPASKTQIKQWLNSLGWVPRTFEYRKNTAGDVNAVAQIYNGSEVCDSVKELYEIEPQLEHLNLLSLINHRISIFKGFLDTMDEEDKAAATVAGFTNTLRFKHSKPIVNLPKPGKFYGDEVRASIIAPDKAGYMLCGADMSALEDTTKQHYMYKYDPEYVIQMRVPGFDPHLDIALLANLLTLEQVEDHKSGKENYSKQRSMAKTVNFAGIYGAGAPKIAQSTGMTLAQATQLHKTYWERNKSVKLVAKNAKHKTVKYNGQDQMWLYNPVSGFWYSLRTEKDKFSTLNQGTGVFCFDMWVREVRAKGIKISMQYHDEVLFSYHESEEENIKQILEGAIDTVNKKLRLNVPLGVSMLFGSNYKETH